MIRISGLLLIVLPLQQFVLANPLNGTQKLDFKVDQNGLQEMSTTESVSYKYAVVVDCGSSGTRAHIYRWPKEASPTEVANLVQPLKDSRTGDSLIKRIRPGLASLKDQPEAASDYMKPIMDFISLYVPVEVQRQTPVYFLGTAGLRLLTKEQQADILEDIAQDLGREYNFPSLDSRVISGAQEGLYQWLSINAYSGRTNANYDMVGYLGKNFYCQAPQSRRFAMLEMGGASAQVAFELVPELDRIVRISLKHQPDALEAYENNQLLLDVEPNKQVKVFSITFLGLGSNSARDLAIDLLVRESMLRWPGRVPPITYQGGRVLFLNDPCLPRGAHEEITKPVELLTDFSRTLGFVAESGQVSFGVRLFGTGNIKACHLLLIRMVSVAKQERLNCDKQQSDWCSTSLIGTNFVPYNQFQFLGLGELFYTTDEMIHSSGRFKAYKVSRRTIEICSTPYRTLMQQFPDANRNDAKRVLLQCFKATWMLTWLQFVIRMPFNYGLDFTTIDTINGNQVDWTLGALIGQMFDKSRQLNF